MGSYTTGDVAAYLPDLKEENWNTAFGTGMDNMDLLASRLRRGILKVVTATDQDATPDVSGAGILKVPNTTATTITNFDGGTLGQEVTLYFSTGNTTIAAGKNISTKTGRNTTVPTQAAMVFRAAKQHTTGLVWEELGRTFMDTNNEGLLVSNNPGVEITSWPSSSTTTYTTVDLSSYGIIGNTNVLLRWYATASGTVQLFARQIGSGDSDAVAEQTRWYQHESTVGYNVRQFWVQVDANSQFEMKFGATFSGSNQGFIDGYFRNPRA